MSQHVLCSHCSHRMGECWKCGNEQYCTHCRMCWLGCGPEHVGTAIAELKTIDAPVYDHLAGEKGCRFVIGAELRHRDDRYFCDYYGYEIREQVYADGKIVNAFGIRQDVHDILAKHGLTAEWWNPAQVGIYDV